MSKKTKQTVSASSKENIFIIWGTFAAFVICVFFASSYKVSGDDDFFWHLSTGRFIVENHYVPDSDVFGYVTQGTRWVPFEWGWDVVTYSLYTLGGYSAILLFRSIVICWFFLILFMLLRKFSVNPLLIFIALFALLIGMMDRLSPRPHLVTYLFIVILLYLLISFKYFERDKFFKYLYFLPLLFLIWGNFHLGVVAGEMIFFVFVINETILFFYPKKFRDIKPVSKEQLKKLLIISAASLAVLFINPHGLETYFYAYGHTKLKMLESIGEWRNPFSDKIDLNFIVTAYKIMLFGGIITIIYGIQKRDLLFVIIYAAFAFYSIRAIRFTVDYEIVMIAFIAISLNFYYNKFLGKYSLFKVPLYRNIILGLFIVIFLNISYLTYTSKIYDALKYYRVSGWGIDDKYMPVQLFDFLKDNNISGNAFNFFETGGYLVWSLPGQKNFIDSRNLNDNIFTEYNSILYIKQGFEKKLEQYGIDYIIYFNPELTIRPNDMKTQITSFAARNPDWKLVYWDDKSMLFLKDLPKFSEICSKFSYKVMNPYNAFFYKSEFEAGVKADPVETRKEMERKSESDPNGYLFRKMSAMAENYLKGL